jgi:hypothetical protein
VLLPNVWRRMNIIVFKEEKGEERERKEGK